MCKLRNAYKKAISPYFKNFKINSIQSIIAFYFAFLSILLMLFLIIILYSKFLRTIDKNALTGTSQIMNQVDVNLDYYLKGMVEVSNLINDDMKEISLQKNNMNDLFGTALRLRKDIVTLAVFSDDGKLIASTSNQKLKNGLMVEEQEWYKNVINDPYSLYFSSPHVQNLFAGQHKWVVSVSRASTFIVNGNAEKGVLLADINFNDINEFCSNVSLGKHGYIYIIDNIGNIIYHPQQQMIYAGTKYENIKYAINRDDGSYIDNYNGKRTVISIKTNTETAWKIIGIADYDEMVATKNEIYYFVIIIFALSIIFILLVSLLLSARISQPIKNLEKVMRKVEQGELNIYAEVSGESEVRKLSQTFNIMIYRIRQLMEQNIKEQEEKRRNELKALQAQINPHFLYNTLDSIVWMAENEENQGVIKMVTALADLFRVSISRGNEQIDIEDELKHARSYLIIQQIRYQDRFDFDIIAQPEALKCKTLKILLQPILENAIYHGIKKMVDKGFIRITVEIIDDRICMKVMDNGLGMTEETLSTILDKKKKSSSKSGIGVKNVHERIKLYFGDEYGLEINSELERGTCVKIWIPKCGDDDICVN